MVGRTRALAGAACLALLTLTGVASTPPALTALAQTAARPVRFDDQIQAFLADDKVNPPPKDGILFIGSSIFRLWTSLKEQMAPLPVFNRAFGGSRTWEILHYMDRIVIPYRPRVIVYYCGSNDVNAGESAVAIFDGIKAFVTRAQAALPETEILYFSINKALDKRDKWQIVDQVNAQVKALAGKTPRLGYIESNDALFDAKGEPRTELYLADGLHFKPPAYDAFTGLIKPVLTKTWSGRPVR